MTDKIGRLYQNDGTYKEVTCAEKIYYSQGSDCVVEKEEGFYLNGKPKIVREYHESLPGQSLIHDDKVLYSNEPSFKLVSCTDITFQSNGKSCIVEKVQPFNDRLDSPVTSTQTFYGKGSITVIDDVMYYREDHQPQSIWECEYQGGLQDIYEQVEPACKMISESFYEVSQWWPFGEK